MNSEHYFDVFSCLNLAIKFVCFDKHSTGHSVARLFFVVVLCFQNSAINTLGWNRIAANHYLFILSIKTFFIKLSQMQSRYVCNTPGSSLCHLMSQVQGHCHKVNNNTVLTVSHGNAKFRIPFVPSAVWKYMNSNQ